MNQIQETFKAECDQLRLGIRVIELDVRGLTPCVGDLPEGTQFQEVNANLMLAVRHLEDARMRLGKAIQWGAQDGIAWGGPAKAPGEQHAASNEAGFAGKD